MRRSRRGNQTIVAPRASTAARRAGIRRPRGTLREQPLVRAPGVNDTTCVEDWLADFHFEEDGTNRCPANSTCVTFQQMYGDGRGLCNRMWGRAFFYETNRDNCTVMRFNSTQPNPNSLLTFPSGTLTVQVTGALLLFLVVMATLL